MSEGRRRTKNRFFTFKVQLNRNLSVILGLSHRKKEMNETQPIRIDNGVPVTHKKNKRSGWRTFGYVMLAIILLLTGVYFFWARPALKNPISAPLALPTMVGYGAEGDLKPPSNLEVFPYFIEPERQWNEKIVCGNEPAWNLLLVGIDYRGENYLYGLADVIRVARVDFVDMTANMVALPRDLVVEAPEGRFTEQNPMKINQAYLFGTEGWGGYAGEGNGANSLAEVIRYNFGVTPHHYAVVDFQTVVNFIDAIGGVELDLPQAVYDPDPNLGSFPAGLQTLNGERALALMRIRTNYSDSFRVGHQNMVIKAIVNKLAQPAMLVKIPGLLDQFKGGFLTDLSVEQIASLGMCFLKNFDTSNLKSDQIPEELLTAGRVYIPSLNGESYVYRWDQRTVDWIHQNLLTQ